MLAGAALLGGKAALAAYDNSADSTTRRRRPGVSRRQFAGATSERRSRRVLHAARREATRWKNSASPDNMRIRR